MYTIAKLIESYGGTKRLWLEEYTENDWYLLLEYRKENIEHISEKLQEKAGVIEYTDTKAFGNALQKMAKKR